MLQSGGKAYRLNIAASGAAEKISLITEIMTPGAAAMTASRSLLRRRAGRYRGTHCRPIPASRPRAPFSPNGHRRPASAALPRVDHPAGHRGETPCRQAARERVNSGTTETSSASGIRVPAPVSRPTIHHDKCTENDSSRLTQQQGVLLTFQVQAVAKPDHVRPRTRPEIPLGVQNQFEMTGRRQ
jgi:hypothetical protein